MLSASVLSATIPANEFWASLSQIPLAANLTTIIAALVFIFIWGYVWSGSMRDDERRPLPPSFAANTFFAVGLCALYIAIVVFGFLAPEGLRMLFGGQLEKLPEAWQQKMPLVAIIALGTAAQVPQIRQMAQRFAVLLHNAQYRKSDEIVLQRHLKSCAYVPPPAEITQNIDYIGQFEVYLTDTNSVSLHLDAVGAWRKVSALLRILKEESNVENGALSTSDREEVARLDDAHRRKTKLAMNIVRMLDHMDANSNIDQKLTVIAAQLADVSHQDRGKIRQAEETARDIISGDDVILSPANALAERPLRISTKQMQEYLRQVERYFLTEYQIILNDASRLAAKLVIQSGDMAADRLASIKKSGFAGLGSLQRLSFDTVLWVVISSFVVTFAAMTASFTLLPPPPGGVARPAPDAMFQVMIALTVSMAVLIGALWGSRRGLAERQTTPWASYAAAGLTAMAGVYSVHIVNFLLDSDRILGRIADRMRDMLPKFVEANIVDAETAKHLAPEAVRNWQLPDLLLDMWPMALGTFFMTVGICWLARLRRWPWAPRLTWLERLSDGAAIAIINVLGGAVASLVGLAFNTSFGLGMRYRMLNQGRSLFDMLVLNPFQGMRFVAGFIIGLIVIREVRRIAHVHLIADPNDPDPAEEAALAGISPAADSVLPPVPGGHAPA
jgi:hypothetical protein